MKEEDAHLIERESGSYLSPPYQVPSANRQKKEACARQQIAQLPQHSQVKWSRVAKTANKKEKDHEAKPAQTRGQQVEKRQERSLPKRVDLASGQQQQSSQRRLVHQRQNVGADDHEGIDPA